MRNRNVRLTGVPEEEREKGTECLFKQIVDVNFPNLWKEPQIQEANSTPSYLNPKRPSLRHIALTLSKSNDKENILKAARKEIGKKAGGKKSDLQRMTHHLITRLLSRNFTSQSGTKYSKY